MSTIEQSIDVHVPVRTAYDQWTQFEQFPASWRASRRSASSTTPTPLGHEGRRPEKEFDASIDRAAARRAHRLELPGRPEHAGVVTFHRLGDGETRVMLQMDYEPEGPAEKAGDLLGVVKHRVKGDLERFKELVEAEGAAEGAWRGEVDQTATR